MARRVAENAEENISSSVSSAPLRAILIKTLFHYLFFKKQIEFPIFDYLTFFRLQAFTY
jgi:hypothetical protein